MIEKDNVLIVIDEFINDENFFAYLSAIQAYEKGHEYKIESWNKIHKDTKKSNLCIYLILPTMRYNDIFKKCLKYLEVIRTDKVIPPSISCACALSYAKAKALSSSTRPLAVSLGMLLGSEAGAHPDVANLLTTFKNRNALLLDRAFESMYPACVEEICNINNIPISLYDASQSLEEQTQLVYECDAVIGISGFATYLASSLRMPVLEYQTQSFLYKWSNPNYFVISSDVDKTIFSTGIKLCLSAIDGLIRTERGTSIARSAEILSERPFPLQV
jgi:hypothetical protein